MSKKKEMNRFRFLLSSNIDLLFDEARNPANLASTKTWRNFHYRPTTSDSGFNDPIWVRVKKTEKSRT